MGYSIHQSCCEFSMAISDFPSALEALKNEEGLEMTLVASFEDSMARLDWDLDIGEECTIGISFIGDRMTDYLPVTLDTIAPWVKGGSFIEMVGEDSEFWRWTFANGKMHEVWPEVTWPAIDLDAEPDKAERPTAEELLAMTSEERSNLDTYNFDPTSGENKGCTNCAVCEDCMNCVGCEDCKNCGGCENCTNCWTCSECTDCGNCNNCEGCDICKKCTDCLDSNGCEICWGCTGCTDCGNCNNCEDCDSCMYCTGCTGVTDCKDCKRCTGCAYCTYCMYCTGCTDCKDCMYCTGCRDCTDCMDCTSCIGISGAKKLLHVAYGVQLTKEQWIMFIRKEE